MSRRPTRGLLFFVALIIAVGAAGTLSACGKKGELESPPEKEETKRR
ncbi:MAG: hypothetical protein J4F40_13380 [Alphaproteobacteria bacterium]|nr:hypothetical protein [Alphaproteobacteria bacterium]MCY4497487.1 hypothetical protein [Rhodospirillaceae bacterium]